MTEQSNWNICSEQSSLNASVGSCGTSIDVQGLLDTENRQKLNCILNQSKLQEIILFRCFSEPCQLLEALSCITKKPHIKSLKLNIKGNKHDSECALKLMNLIRVKSLISLELPEGIDEVDMEDVLKQIFLSKAKLDVLDISGNILNENSIVLLGKLIKHRNVKEALFLSGCRGVEGSMLTDSDQESLKVAKKEAERWFPKFLRNIDICWFEFVPKIPEEDLDSEDLDVVEFQPKRRFSGTLGRYESAARYLIRKKEDQWYQLAKGRRKRKRLQEDSPSKKMKMDEEVNSIADLMGSQNLGKCPERNPCQWVPGDTPNKGTCSREGPVLLPDGIKSEIPDDTGSYPTEPTLPCTDEESDSQLHLDEQPPMERGPGNSLRSSTRLRGQRLDQSGTQHKGRNRTPQDQQEPENGSNAPQSRINLRCKKAVVHLGNGPQQSGGYDAENISAQNIAQGTSNTKIKQSKSHTKVKSKGRSSKDMFFRSKKK